MVRGNINTSTHPLPFVTRINCSYLTIKVLFAVELSIRKIVKEALITPSAFQFRTVHPSAFQSKHLRNSSLLTFQMTVSVNLRLSAPPLWSVYFFKQTKLLNKVLTFSIVWSDPKAETLQPCLSKIYMSGLWRFP